MTKFNKRQAYYDAIDKCFKFLAANGIDQPIYKQRRLRGHYGCYYPQRQVVCTHVEYCLVPSTSNYSWSWPGYTADLTPLGVVAHETGHHCHHASGCREMSREFKQTGEPGVTSYGRTCISEAIAEAFKVFITNPALLQAIAPGQYDVIMDFGFVPTETRCWREVLADSPRHIAAVERKIG